MKAPQDKPLTEAELFKILESFMAQLERLFDHGVMAEGADWQVDSIKANIADKQDEIRRLRKSLEQVRGYITRRKKRESERR